MTSCAIVSSSKGALRPQKGHLRGLWFIIAHGVEQRHVLSGSPPATTHTIRTRVPFTTSSRGLDCALLVSMLQRRNLNCRRLGIPSVGHILTLTLTLTNTAKASAKRALQSAVRQGDAWQTARWPRRCFDSKTRKTLQTEQL